MHSGCMLFFFKQKTAYEMRISDWSSDVCSSDLAPDAGNQVGRDGADDVVDLQLVEQRYREDDQGAADAADDQGHAMVLQVGACGDGDEAGDGTVQRHGQVDLLVEQLRQDHGGHHAGAGGEVGVDVDDGHGRRNEGGA